MEALVGACFHRLLLLSGWRLSFTGFPLITMKAIDAFPFSRWSSTVHMPIFSVCRRPRIVFSGRFGCFPIDFNVFVPSGGTLS